RVAEAKEVEGLALAALAEVLAELGGVDDAMEIAQRARETASPPALPRALRCLGKLQRRQRRLDEAHKTLLDALDAARQVEDCAEQARVLRELAVVRAGRGETRDGLDAVAEALALDLDAGSAVRLRAGLLW